MEWNCGSGSGDGFGGMVMMMMMVTVVVVWYMESIGWGAAVRMMSVHAALYDGEWINSIEDEA